MTITRVARVYCWTDDWDELEFEQQKALARQIQRENVRIMREEPIHAEEEIIDSRNALLELVSPNDDILDLSGPRALAWLENHILSPLRIPWSGPERRRLARFGPYYRPGLVKPCPLTGVCYDEDLLSTLACTLRDGATVREAIQAFFHTARTLIAQEQENFESIEYATEVAEQSGPWEWPDDAPLEVQPR